MSLGLSSLTSLFSNAGAQAVGAGLLSGAIGGTALVTTGLVPLGGATAAPEAVTLLACPGSGEALATVTDGGKLLVTGQSEDGQWYEVYLGQPGVDRAWAPASALQLDAAPDSLPVADCEAPAGPLPPPATPTPRPTPSPTPAPTPSPTPIPTPSPTPSVTARVTASPTAKPTKPGATKTPAPSPTKTPSPTPTKTPSPTPTKTPNPTPTKTPNPTPNPGPSLSELTASPQTFCSGSSQISVTATDPQGIKVVRITYRPNGGPTYGPFNMSDSGSNVWKYTIVPDVWSEGFVSVTVTAYDNFDAQTSLSNVNDVNDPSSLYATSFC